MSSPRSGRRRSASLAGCLAVALVLVPGLVVTGSAAEAAPATAPATAPVTAAADAPATSVPLGSAAGFAVLAGSAITNTGPSSLTGNAGTSPGTAVTPGAWHINGTVDTDARQAHADLDAAITAAAAMPVTAEISTDLGGQTLGPGVYSAGAAMALTGRLTLDAGNDPDAEFVFQMGSTLTTASASRVLLVNGAQACHVFWQVGSSATLGTESSLRGTVLANASITAATNVTVDGRLLALNAAVTMDDNLVTVPTCGKAPAGGTAAVDLGAASSFAILASSGTTNTGPSTTVGDMGSYPTGTETGQETMTVNGTDHHDDAVSREAQDALVAAYRFAADATPVEAPAELGGATLPPGTHSTAASFGLTGTLVLDAQHDPNAQFIFQAGSSLLLAAQSTVKLVNGASACNVFWQVGSSATLGTQSALVGTVLAMASVTAGAGATVDGRVLARTGAVTLSSNTVSSCSRSTSKSQGSGPLTGSGVRDGVVTTRFSCFSTAPDGSVLAVWSYANMGGSDVDVPFETDGTPTNYTEQTGGQPVAAGTTHFAAETDEPAAFSSAWDSANPGQKWVLTTPAQGRTQVDTPNEVTSANSCSDVTVPIMGNPVGLLGGVVALTGFSAAAAAVRRRRRSALA